MIELKALSKIHVFPFYKWLNDKESIKYSLSIFQKIKNNCVMAEMREKMEE